MTTKEKKLMETYPDATKFLNEYCIEHELEVNNMHVSEVIECMESFQSVVSHYTMKLVNKTIKENFNTTPK